MKEVLYSSGLAYIFFFFSHNIILEGSFLSGTATKVLIVCLEELSMVLSELLLVSVDDS